MQILAVFVVLLLICWVLAAAVVVLALLAARAEVRSPRAASPSEGLRSPWISLVANITLRYAVVLGAYALVVLLLHRIGVRMAH